MDIHEKPEERHRLARLIVGVALLWGCVLVAVVETGGITKRAIKRVKRRDTGYNRNTWVTHAGNTWRSNVGAGPGDSSANHTGNTPAYGSTYWTRAWPYTVYNASKADYAYDKDVPTYVEHSDTIWRTVRANTPAGQTPAIGSNYWVRGDLCGKILGSCKCRFQFQPDSGNNNLPSTNKNTEKVLPFGGFPGSEKYR